MSTIIVATLFGPLIVGTTVFAAMAAMIIAQAEIKIAARLDFVHGLATEFVVIIGAAYLGGGVIAFEAGSIVALFALWRTPTLTGVLVAAIVANVGYYAVADPAVFAASGSTLPLRKLLISILFSIYSSTACWFIFRRPLTWTSYRQ